MEWVALTVSGPAEALAAIEAILYDAGAAGLVEDGPARIAYFPHDRAADRIRRVEAACSALSPPVQVTHSRVDDEDWQHAWKRFFHPLRVGRRLIVEPSWEPADRRPGDLVVEIDPGMAFGTGTHDTTQCCLEALEDACGSRAAGFSVLDMGTGSGILAIAAARLGAGRVVALDNDTVATAAAAENCRRNRVDRIVTVQLGEAPPGGSFDVVIANIVAAPIIALASALWASVAPGGHLIVSGIVDDRQEAVEHALAAAGASPARWIARGEWRTAVVSRS